MKLAGVGGVEAAAVAVVGAAAAAAVEAEMPVQ